MITVTAITTKASPEIIERMRRWCFLVTTRPREEKRTNVKLTLADITSTPVPKIMYVRSPAVLRPVSSVVAPTVKSQSMKGGLRNVIKNPRTNGVPLRPSSALGCWRGGRSSRAILTAENPSQRRKAAPTSLSSGMIWCRRRAKPVDNSRRRIVWAARTPSNIARPWRKLCIPSVRERKNIGPGTRNITEHVTKTYTM